MKGILILNTGSPASERPQDVGRFIGDMLSDKKVLDLPNPLRSILARWIIAPKRQKDSASHYQLIWDYEHRSSPLVFHARELCRKLEEKTGIAVAYAFRYGHPNVEDAIKQLEIRQPQMTELLVMHLFPHFAQSSYQTAVDQVVKYYKKRDRAYSLRVVKPYYNHPEFIRALSLQLKPFTDQPYDKLLFSYHSLPLRHLRREKGRGHAFDYVFQTEETMRLLTAELGLDGSKNRIAYSSAIGKNWKRPFLEDVINELVADGEQNIVAICAGFPADNLESLYDLGVEALNVLKLKNGGTLRLVPGLNSEDAWVEAVWNIVNQNDRE